MTSKERNARLKSKQIRKYCTDQIAMLDNSIYFGQLSKAQIAEARETIAMLYGVLNKPKLIEKVASHCVVLPRIITIKYHDGRKKRKIHPYVHGIPQAFKLEGIF